ncbi:MAG: DNA-formamidopyrimidine glycosylase [Leptolyngbya sp.]|nr:MAG: DNA-formamidopyrimidine glycosylase [Leptolyngbya sp.]
MPELPEVETVRRGLNRLTLNQEIQGGEVLLDRTISRPIFVSEFLSGLTGTAIAQWHRRGKYLIAELVQGIGSEEFPTPAGYLGAHLRMTGQLLWVDAAEPVHKHTRVRLFFQGDRELRFVDQRTFGQLWWVPPNQSPEQIITGLQALGPEPFSAEFSVDYFYQQLHSRQRPIKNALLDQRIVAGLGNIYADEALFLSGIHPQTLCSTLTRNQVKLLHSTTLKVLQDSIDANGTTFSTFRNVEGINGNYGGKAWVYGRDGETCRTCETVIHRVKMAGRSAHFCPQCQR